MIRHWNAITSHKWRKDRYTSTGIVLTRWWLWMVGWGANSVLGLILSTFYSIFFFGVSSGVELSILKIKPKELGGSLRPNFWKTWHVCTHREEKHPMGLRNWQPCSHTRNKGGVSHCVLAIHTKKYFKTKEELWKLKYFTMQKHNLQKIQKKKKKKPKIHQDIITL
jgi:hypothetical protein